MATAVAGALKQPSSEFCLDEIFLCDNEEDGDHNDGREFSIVAKGRQSPPDLRRVSSPDDIEWMCTLDQLFSLGDDQDQNDWCSLFYMINYQRSMGKTNSSFFDEHSSVGQIEDGESIATTSTLGRGAMFGDLNSLPSVGDSKIKALNNNNNNNKDLEKEIEDGSTIASIGELSALSIPEERDVVSYHSDEVALGDNDSIASTPSMNSDRAEAVLESKLKEAAAAKTMTTNRDLSEARLITIPSHQSSHPSHGSLQKSRGDASILGRQSTASSVESRRAVLVRELRRAVDTHGRYDVRCGNITAAIGDLFDESGEFDQSLRMHQEAVAIYSAKLGDHHVTTIDAKVRLAKVMEKLGDFDGALQMFFHVFNMRRALARTKDASIPDTMSFISGVLKKTGKTTRAIRELKRALKLYREALGDAHPRVTGTVDDIASLYVDSGDHTKAAAILEELVKLKAATLGVNNSEVGKTLMELASAHEAGGEHEKAMKSLKKSYSIFSSMHGEESEQAMKSLERIAQNYRATKEHEKAVAAYLGVLKGRKNLFGDASPVVADTYLNVGLALRENRQHDKAMKCLRQALSIFVGEGKDMNDVGMIAEAMHEMAVTHRCKGQNNEAAKIFKQELAIRRKMGDRELPRVAKALNRLGKTELEMRDYTNALNFFMEALSVYEKIDAEPSVNFAETLFNTGLVFESTRHHERAKEAFTESVRIFKGNGVSDDDELVKVATARLGLLDHVKEDKNNGT